MVDGKNAGKITNDIKREIIEFAFKNPVWDGEKLTSELSECAELVLSFAESVDSGIIKVEPPSDPCKKDPLGPSCCVWQGRQELNPYLRFWRPLY